MKAKNKDAYCNLDYFMKHGCTGCKLGRKCEEYYENGIERNRDNRNNINIDNFNNKKFISEVKQNDNERLR